MVAMVPNPHRRCPSIHPVSHSVCECIAILVSCSGGAAEQRLSAGLYGDAVAAAIDSDHMRMLWFMATPIPPSATPDCPLQVSYRSPHMTLPVTSTFHPEALTHCGFDVGPASQTLAQHRTHNGLTPRVCSSVLFPLQINSPHDGWHCPTVIVRF